MTNRVVSLAAALSLALSPLLLAACAVTSPGPTLPNQAGSGASVEGTIQQTRSGFVLEGDDGRVLYALENTSVLASPQADAATHVGHKVAVTGLVVEGPAGTKVLRIGSIVVERSVELEPVIAAIVAARCPEAPFEDKSSYRMDVAHQVTEASFPIHVAAGGGQFMVWVRRDPAAPRGFAVDSVSRQEGKVFTQICKRP